MNDVPDLILRLEEAASEYETLGRSPFLHEFLASLGYDVEAFSVPDWGEEFRAWAVCHVALFRARGFARHPERDPACSAAYWMVAFLHKCWPDEDSRLYLNEAMPALLTEARNPDAVRHARALAERGWVPPTRPPTRRHAAVRDGV